MWMAGNNLHFPGTQKAVMLYPHSDQQLVLYLQSFLLSCSQEHQNLLQTLQERRLLICSFPISHSFHLEASPHEGPSIYGNVVEAEDSFHYIRDTSNNPLVNQRLEQHKLLGALTTEVFRDYKQFITAKIIIMLSYQLVYNFKIPFSGFGPILPFKIKMALILKGLWLSFVLQ